MPYIMVEEVPEGMEAVEVVPKSDYDTVAAERDQYQQQRDDALERIGAAEEAAREAKAKYADYILGAGSRKQTASEPKRTNPINARELFAIKR